MNVGRLVGLGGIAGGALLLVEFRQIGTSADAAVGGVALIMLFVGAGIFIFSLQR